MSERTLLVTVQCQWPRNGVQLKTGWFTRASLAVQWAEEQRRTILAGAVEWA